MERNGLRMNVQKNAYPPYPEYPYSPPVKGLFHNQIPVNSDIPGKYSVYIPDNFEHCSPGVMILTPDETSAQDSDALATAGLRAGKCKWRDRF